MRRMATNAITCLLGILLLGTALQAQEALTTTTCSDLTPAGTYGFVLTGTRIGGTNPGPRTAVSKLTFDGKGAITQGAETNSSNGIVLTATFTGTYSVNPDCTGSATVTLSTGEVRNFHFVILANKEIEAIQSDTGRVTTMDAKALF